MKNFLSNNYFDLTKQFLLKMRITFLLLLVFTSSLFAVNVNSQNAKTIVILRDAPVIQVIRSIENQTDYLFVYDKNKIDMTRSVSFDVKRQSVANALKDMFSKTNVNYAIEGNNIMLIAMKNNQQQKKKKITGKVVDINNQPLPGVTVIVKGTTQGTITDVDGNYMIANIPVGAVLQFSFVGMTKQNIIIDNQYVINVTMMNDAIGIDEVVAIGYGTQSRKKVTSSLSEVDMKGLKDMPITSSGQILQGRASGISVNENSGTPGATPRITIHGLSSINAGIGPLVVIDGFPVGTSMPQSLNPNDIKKMTVLKDAASTSIYGARGSNGVILIETVNAEKSQTEVEYSVSEGFQYYPENWRYSVLNAQQYAQYNKERVEELNAFSGKSDAVPQIYLDALSNPEKYKNIKTWQDYLFRDGSDAMLHNHNLTIKTGNKKLQAVVSGGYQKQNGIIPNSDFERYSFRTNVKSDIAKWLKSTASISLARTKSNSIPESGSRGIFMKSVTMSPLQSPYDEDGNVKPYLPADSPGYFACPNPLYEAINETDKVVGKNIDAIMGFDVQIMEGLHYKPRVYIRLFSQNSNTFSPSTIGRWSLGSAGNLAGGAPPFVNSASNSSQNLTNWGIDNLLTYDKTIGDHTFGALIGYTAQKESGEVSKITGTGFPSDGKINYLEASETKALVSDGSNWALNAVFVRLNYDYKARYLAEMNFRREGSSKFGSNNKYGNFPSASLGWRVSQEDFYPKDFFMNELKFRASYGITGNSSIGDFDRFGKLVSIPNLSNVSNNYNYVLNDGVVVGKTLTSLGNQNLKWEISHQLDVGFNAELFNNCLTLKASYFKKITKDMLFNVSIPDASGFSTARDNVGEMENRGWDIEIGANLSSHDFSWSGNLSISTLKNEVTDMPKEISKIISGKNVTQVGYAVGSLYGYIIDGTFNTDKQINDPDLYGWQGVKKLGAFIYRDVNNDGKIDGSDKTVIGNPHPKVQIGFNNVFNYKDFSLSILTTGAFGYDILSQTNEVLYNEKGRWNVSTKMQHRWKSEKNPGKGLICAIYYPGGHTTCDDFVESGNHIWVKNITLGYKVPEFILSKIKVISSLRLYCSVQNAFKITNYSGPNPQVSSNGGGSDPQQYGVDNFSYPVNRTISFGANIKF